MAKWFLRVFLVGLGCFLLFISTWFWENQGGKIVSPLASLKKGLIETNPYASLSFDELAKTKFEKGEIKLGAATRQGKNFTTYVFTYKSKGKTVSGMANIPKESLPAGRQKPFPVVVLLRGWVDRKVYYIGHGTEKQADYFAEHGFLTLAPDFLGYGESDFEDKDILVARFTRPITVLSLLAAIPSLPQADPQRIGLWAHSNGGQIALSVLEITQKPYPTSLWAPVSLGFPESVLVYLGEQDDGGNLIKAKLEEFSKTNDPKKYSITEYWEQIQAPFIIHQGGKDSWIKTEWTQSLVEKLKANGLTVSYYFYPAENHNFNLYSQSAQTLRQRDLHFYQKHLMP